MFIPLKYSQGENNGLEGPVTTCRYCKKKFVIPVEKVQEFEDVCSEDACKIAYDKQQMATQLEEKKKNSPESDIVKMALGK